MYVCHVCMCGVWGGGGWEVEKSQRLFAKVFQELTIFHSGSACDFPNLFPANSNSPACEGHCAMGQQKCYSPACKRTLCRGAAEMIFP